MRVTEVKYMRRHNLGNYEHEELAATAVLEDGEDHFQALASLKSDLAASQAGEVSGQANALGGETAAAPVAEEKPAKGKKGAVKPKKEPEPKVEEEEETEEEEENDDEKAVDPEESEEEEETEEEEEAPPVVEKTGKKFKKKPQTYSRDSEQHKEIYSKMLLGIAPDWKKTDAGKQRGKDVSQKMVGKDFLDENGNVLDSFKAEVKKSMSKK